MHFVQSRLLPTMSERIDKLHKYDRFSLSTSWFYFMHDLIHLLKNTDDTYIERN